MFVHCSWVPTRWRSFHFPDRAVGLDRAERNIENARCLIMHKPFWQAKWPTFRLRKKVQSVHEIVFQGRVDGLRILFGLKSRLVDSDQFLSFAGFLTKTVIGDAI